MKAADVLHKHQLKRTSCREGIIELIMSADQALSVNDIRDRLSAHYDRTTFYRSFKALEEHQILHKIVIDSQVVKYALAKDITSNEGHPHFYCNHCNQVKCLENQVIQELRLPSGYSESEMEVLIKGVCASCKTRED